MCCMVKLNDLEELVELLLGGTLGASTSAPPQEEAMDMEEVGRLAEVNDMAHSILGKQISVWCNFLCLVYVMFEFFCPYQCWWF